MTTRRRWRDILRRHTPRPLLQRHARSAISRRRASALPAILIPALPAALVIIFVLMASSPVEAMTYQTPPPPLGDIVEAPLTPAVVVSPDNAWMVLIERPSMLELADVSAPELRLGGLRIQPGTNGRSRTWPYTSLTFQSVSGSTVRPVTGVPEGSRIGNVIWSPDSSHVAFTITGGDAIHLWVAAVADGRARKLLEDRLNGVSGEPCEWLSDSRSLHCATVPAGRGAPPEAAPLPAGPVTQENTGKVAPARTYQDLLKNAHDEELFEHYLQAQIVRVDLERKVEKVGRPGMIWSFSSSPDGLYLRVSMLHRPFSYLVPAYRFPRLVEIWDRKGKVVRQIADLPLQEEVPIPFGSVPTGPRSFGWRADTPATVYWTEAQDGGDARVEAEVRDSVFMLAAPFSGEPVKLVDLGLRYGSMRWSSDGLAMASSWWWKTRRQRTWIVKPGKPGADPELLFDYSWEDRYNDPGYFVMRPNEWGRKVLMTGRKGKALFLIGDGASEEGDRPFFDELDLASHETKRLWRSEAPFYERPVRVMDEKGRKLLTRRESVEEQPNYYIRDLQADHLEQVTEFPHPTPQLAGLQKELIRYEREDGVMMTATLYTPPGYDRDRDGPLPVLAWAYPQEFKSADAAGQVTDSPYRFDRVGWWSPLLFLTRGYAILDDPTMPIVGEGDDEPNDTFVQQLVSSARAALDELARRGVGDPQRVAIGGHSYGAFMTANLLAHSDLFRAGIARSGAYNRTLTPFGFQAEERTLWEAPEIYFQMSPFMHAEKVNEPILLIHGDSDSNSGTYPMQSERYYSALKGQGATARLVMLPDESHGYRARESILHMLWEMSEWLDTYVMPPPPEDEALSETGKP